VFALDVSTHRCRKKRKRDFIQVRVFFFPLADFTAKSAAASATWIKRPIFFQFFFLDPLEGIEILDFTRDLAIQNRSYRNCVISPMPLTPATSSSSFSVPMPRADQSNTVY